MFLKHDSVEQRAFPGLDYVNVAGRPTVEIQVNTMADAPQHNRAGNIPNV